MEFIDKTDREKLIEMLAKYGKKEIVKYLDRKDDEELIASFGDNRLHGKKV